MKGRVTGNVGAKGKIAAVSEVTVSVRLRDNLRSKPGKPDAKSDVETAVKDIAESEGRFNAVPTVGLPAVSRVVNDKAVNGRVVNDRAVIGGVEIDRVSMGAVPIEHHPASQVEKAVTVRNAMTGEATGGMIDAATVGRDDVRVAAKATVEGRIVSVVRNRLKFSRSRKKCSSRFPKA